MVSSSEPPSGTPVPLHRSATRFMHKNNLQGFAQRSNIAFPIYQTINEGQQHAPKFRSTVWVDGTSFTSQTTFFHRKAAEQEAARLALECLTERNREEGTSRVCEISTFCKALLNEYASKLNLERPTYNTVQLEGVIPVFKSSLVFNGMSYTGEAAKSKKEAEQLAARAVILSILGNSGSGTKLIEMIKSKSKLYDMFKGKGLQDIHASAVSSAATIRNTPVELGNKDMGVAGSVANYDNETKVEFPESSRTLSTCHEFQMPKQGSAPGTSNSADVFLQSGSAHSTDDNSSLKNRKKNKKANKKPRLESRLLVAAFPLNQDPSCSVAQ
ncbi:double-stranded RNA-binding protein 4-like isoform X2 [Abrus precatorius]|uniref:Double-stranded RNA-binding protein 4-like isoform X2 n=2 Tax=Abrus precatorius TaxID=3816 RepID=A0A8B8JK32_ABRPR|nr:double-stranded RNA-binding protein 4-like isoform X2 [Abrus precatorius]